MGQFSFFLKTQNGLRKANLAIQTHHFSPFRNQNYCAPHFSKIAPQWRRFDYLLQGYFYLFTGAKTNLFQVG